MGIVEQLQNGVTAPNRAARSSLSLFWPPSSAGFYGLAPFAYQADTGTNHYKQQRKLDGENTNISAASCSIASQLLIRNLLDKSIFPE